ncbi:MAG: hypothetical protein AAFN40_27310 [Cyanobacteria bacterium J06560_6]
MSELTNTSLIQRGVNAFNSKLFRQWSLMTIVSTVIGPISISIYTIAAIADIRLPNSLSVQLITSLLNGLCFGFLQWIVLRKVFRRAYWWIVATGLGHMAFSLLFVKLGIPMLETFADPSVWGVASFFESSFAYTLISWIFSAVIIGGAQWLFLRRQLDNIRLWIPAVFISQLLLLPVALIPEPQSVQPGLLEFLGTPTGLTIAGQLAKSAVAGFVVSLPTGLLLSDAITRKS